MATHEPARCLEFTGREAGIAVLRAEADSVLASLRRRKIVLHFAGGLMDRTSAVATLNDAVTAYTDAEADSVFFVHGGGLGETLRLNLPRILREALFEILLRRVLWCVLGKAAKHSVAGARASGGLQLPPRDVLEAELTAMRSGIEPDPARFTLPELSALTEDETKRLTYILSLDEDLSRCLRAEEENVMGGALVVSSVHAGMPADPGRSRSGVLEAAAGFVARKALNAVRAVIERFRGGTHHGLYPTAVEEILREFCLAPLGGAVWAGMKADAATAFRTDIDGGPRPGSYFLQRITEMLAGPEPKEVTVVGHGSGLPLMNAFVAALDAHRSSAVSPLPADFRVRQVIALAPACTFADLAATLRRKGTAFERFRMFALTDEAETADHLVPLAYPRSLLYFISGVLERDARGASAVVPLAGMARWYAPGQVTGGAEAEEVRAAVDVEPDSFVWAPSAGPAGHSCAVRSHAGFQTDATMLASLREIVSE